MTTPTTAPPEFYESTLGWMDGVLENETLADTCARVEKEFNVRLHKLVPDTFNRGCYDVTFRGTADNLVALWASDEGGGYAVSDIDEGMIVEVTQ